jgi:predicted TIM-barrel fold metal-dependent hydrolase
MTTSDLPLRQWRPRAQVQVTTTQLERAATPAIDAHNHLGRWLSTTNGWLAPNVVELLGLMDRTGLEAIVNLDGRWGEELSANIRRFDQAHPNRFFTFCHIDWTLLKSSTDAKVVASQLRDQLRESAELGARGVKVWKDLGLSVKDAAGRLVMPDEPQVVAVIREAGQLGLPVLIHTADPVAFFDPLDDRNERLDELAAHPEWWFGGSEYPTFQALIRSLDSLVGECPDTTFIGAHVGCWAENLRGVSDMLRRHPNWNVDLGGRLAEIGRQPGTFRRFVEEFPDRVVFGTDSFPASADSYRRYFRFLETDDEHFPYSDDPVPLQGRWAISGCALEPEILSAVYADNARRLIAAS